MKEQIVINPIGVIRTPYREPKGMPIQGRFKEGITGRAEVFPEYKEGLKDIDGFSHLILVYHFNRTKGERITARPYLEDQEHGVFSIRSPWRPNHLGISVVKLVRVEEAAVVFSEVDMLDETPLIDIKPYVSFFDARQDVKNGWIEKHFKDGRLPDTVINPGHTSLS